jgi:hypothetical protein
VSKKPRRKKTLSANSAVRFIARREGGNDFCVIDTRRKNAILATGLDRDEADQTATAWNAARQSNKYPQSAAL